MMYKLAVLGAGGALGTMLRFVVSEAVYTSLGRSFPYGTLVVNVLGSLVLGYLFIPLLRPGASEHWYFFLGVGCMGAFTTFSTFSLDTFRLIQLGQQWAAFGNVFANLSLCLLATFVGMLLANFVHQ